MERVKAGLVVATLTSIPRIHTDQQRSVELLGQRERMSAGTSTAARRASGALMGFELPCGTATALILYAALVVCAILLFIELSRQNRR